MDLSVVIPVYNDQERLDACLSAISYQYNPEKIRYEIIVVDNNSSPPISNPTNPSTHLKFITCKTPGAYAARNMGASIALGDIIAFLDADCIPDENWVREGILAIRKYGNLVNIGGNVLFNTRDSKSVIEKYQTAMGFMQKQNIEQNYFSATANLFVYKKVWQQVGVFDERLYSGADKVWGWLSKELGVATHYAPSVIVRTPSRMSLASAIKQARRISGGQEIIKKLYKENAIILKYQKQTVRPLTTKLNTIFNMNEYSMLDRFIILSAASIIFFFSKLERLKLALKFKPERQ